MIAVIGSGLGGLSAAVSLAQAGREVVVFEQHHEPGGFASSFQRGPYTFEISLHAIDAVGPGEPHARLLEQLGILGALDLRPLPTDRRERWVEAGLDEHMPHGRDAWLDRLAALFPHEADGARAVFDLAERVHASAYAWMERGAMQSDPEIRRVLSKTALQVVGEHMDDPLAVQLLLSLATYLGLPGERLGAMPFLLLLHGYYGLSAAWPAGGSRAITEALVAELERLGGRLVLDTAVTGIRCRRRRVRSIVAGEEHPVDAVVANCSPLTTFGKLLSPRDVPGRTLERLRSMELSSSIYALYLGVRDVGGLPEHAYESFLHQVRHPLLVNSRLALTARHLAEPGCCPPGHGVFEIATCAPSQEGLALRDPGIEEAMISLVEAHLLPGLRERIEVRSLAHPGTFSRYTATPRGATFGFAMTPEQSGIRGLQTRTGVEGLYQAGAWVRPGAGQSAVMISGRQAAKELILDCG